MKKLDIIFTSDEGMIEFTGKEINDFKTALALLIKDKDIKAEWNGNQVVYINCMDNEKVEKKV